MHISKSEVVSRCELCHSQTTWSGLDTVSDTTQEFFTVSGFGRGDGPI